MFENVRQSFQSVWAHKLRSFLTMLGIIIGIAAIIAIVSIINGTNKKIQENLIGSGTNSVYVRITESGDLNYDMAYGGIPKGFKVLDSDVRDQINEMDHVLDASLYVFREGSEDIFYNSTQLQNGTLVGGDSHYLHASGNIIYKGRNLVEDDFTNFRKVALIDSVASEGLFPAEDPIGKVLDIKGEIFTIVGVFQQAKEFAPEINSEEDYDTYVSGRSSQGVVLIPDVDWPMVAQFDEPQNVIALADSTDTMTDVGKSVASFLNEYMGIKDSANVKYRAEDLTKTAEKTQQLANSTNQQLIWIAGISLLVGGIGVMNIMLVSVTERTREIGLKKAVGARKNKILIQFLTEAAVLTSTGGILGTIAGVVAAEVWSKMEGARVAISYPSIVIAIVFSMIIGIVFGLLPAVKASNLDPIVALRHE